MVSARSQPSRHKEIRYDVEMSCVVTVCVVIVLCVCLCAALVRGDKPMRCVVTKRVPKLRLRRRA